MAHAGAMVGHGGSGSTLMAMAAGVPLAVVPLFVDQPYNARRVAALGAGLATFSAVGGG
jgi:UDP:flavonoid glycosyltransferase YjiC (YdhE family)